MSGHLSSPVTGDTPARRHTRYEVELNRKRGAREEDALTCDTPERVTPPLATSSGGGATILPERPRRRGGRGCHPHPARCGGGGGGQGQGSPSDLLPQARALLIQNYFSAVYDVHLRRIILVFGALLTGRGRARALALVAGPRPRAAPSVCVGAAVRSPPGPRAGAGSNVVWGRQSNLGGTASTSCLACSPPTRTPDPPQPATPRPWRTPTPPRTSPQRRGCFAFPLTPRSRLVRQTSLWRVLFALVGAAWRPVRPAGGRWAEGVWDGRGGGGEKTTPEHKYSLSLSPADTHMTYTAMSLARRRWDLLAAAAAGHPQPRAGRQALVSRFLTTWTRPHSATERAVPPRSWKISGARIARGRGRCAHARAPGGRSA
ncbi:hypothetical protein L1887_52098 [Cichorium endivia]|nr:hypothetical protein L1887_52098 [Cichorium endivia]